jgi:hypothetical protein
MFGDQCVIGTGVFQIWNGGLGGGWVNATYSGGNIPCSVNANAFNSLVVRGHIVTGDQTSCTSGGRGYPLLHYDLIIWNGNSYIPTNTNTCAQPLNASFSSLVFQQIQADVGNAGSGGAFLDIWYDELRMSYY